MAASKDPTRARRRGPADVPEGVAPALGLTAPNGGETWYVGTTRTITWSSNLPASDGVTLEPSGDGGATWSALGTAPDTGAFDRIAAGPATGSADSVKLELSRDGGATWSALADAAEGSAPPAMVRVRQSRPLPTRLTD